jgi:hypothetical protein
MDREEKEIKNYCFKINSEMTEQEIDDMITYVYGERI